MASQAMETNQHLPCASLRVLSPEEEVKLEKQNSSIVSEYKQRKFETEARKNWDVFYKRNEARFFRDRHWTIREFSELVNLPATQEKALLEVGCGVGNFFYPLLEEGLNWRVFACDFSPRAIDLVQQNPHFDSNRIHAFVIDITTHDFRSLLPPETTVDVASLIFVLSAIHPDKFAPALSNIFHILKPGGLLIFRDYGLNDMAQIRFGHGSKLDDNFYVRQDGTRSYFFSTEEMFRLVSNAGFHTESCDYVQRRTINKKEGVDKLRIFVQGQFRKPT